MKFSELQRLQRREGITVISSDARIEQLEARLCTITKECDALRAAMEKIADWYGAWGPYPETNKSWCAMAIVTAREAVKPLTNLCAKGEEK